ncbi:ABC transporter permease [Streptacidiphilus albus]|uniref:ABC transporter permease n=1 Tax=Streptacidiphilus albus TaxID=105425 RepID=UPI00054C22E6|nr:ABC transporter permease [Streptacidiphilus albus]
MTMPTEAALDPTADPAGAEGGPASGSKNAELVGRSPGQLAWIRIKRDKVAVICAVIVALFFVVAYSAPLIAKLYGKNPYTPYGLVDPNLTDASGMPLGSFGGISSQYWLGIEPGGLGRDVFTLLIYGMRTTLTISVLATILSTVLGVGLGLAQGYLGGKADYWLGRISDLLMAFPQQLFFIAFTPVVIALFYPPGNAVPTWFRGTALIVVQVALGWMGLGRLLRGMTLSLREREFIEAAKIAGASPWRIIRKELMPNLGTTILVQTTLSLSGFVTTEAGLSFLGVGMVDPTPDWGRLFQDAAPYYQTDLAFLLVPGLSLMIFTIAFNLLGDSVRDALDPKTAR